MSSKIVVEAEDFSNIEECVEILNKIYQSNQIMKKSTDDMKDYIDELEKKLQYKAQLLDEMRTEMRNLKLENMEISKRNREIVLKKDNPIPLKNTKPIIKKPIYNHRYNSLFTKNYKEKSNIFDIMMKRENLKNKK